MKTDDETTETAGPTAKSKGPGMILVAIYAVFSLSAGARALYQIVAKFDAAPVSFILSGVAAAIYIVATISLARRGLNSYWAAVWAIVVEFLGVIAVGIFSLVRPELFPLASVWSHFGAGYGYVPLVLPIVGLLWLYRNRPTKRAH
ncbi:hypothetical protein [Kocuria massiliensis]|uniref:hypothetical protein n=1 Tax=Kocuria massiliensis TaxID=1926282 RepID=UPI001FE3AEA7|nr:hypothetical protein [Kocuria massiliensis]MCT1367863.1 hypothetical protein [Rothia sp. p3-SID1597]